MRTTTRLGAVVLGAAVLTTAAVGGVLAQDVEGTVDVHGSSTVAPISLAVSEDFAARQPGLRATPSARKAPATASRSSSASTTATSPTPRAPSTTTRPRCAPRTASSTVELKIGYDGLAVITSPENPIECLNKYDLWALFGAESNDITTWQDAEAFAHEMGSTTDFPDGDIAITAPGTESGTYDSFIELALGPAAEERGVDAAHPRPGAADLRRRRQRPRHHPGRLAVPDLDRLRRPRLRRQRRRCRQDRRRSTRARAASRPAPRRSRTGPTP